MAHDYIKGSISHGTLRTRDLIPRFAKAASHISMMDFTAFMITLEASDIDFILNDVADEERWHSRDAWAVYEGLETFLMDHAPEGYFFGAHPGDGSDFGFWRLEEELTC